MGKTQGIVGTGTPGRAAGRTPAGELNAPLAPAKAVRSYKRRHRQNPIITTSFLDGMAKSLAREMMFPDDDGRHTAPNSKAVEINVARHSNGHFVPGKKYWDTLVTTGQAQNHNTGLEVKLCSNIKRKSQPVLGRATRILNEGETLDSLSPDEVGRRVCRVESEKKARTQEQLTESGLPAPEFSELLIVKGDPATETFQIWTEPYEVNEELADRLIWRRVGEAFQAFTPEVCAAAETQDDLGGKQVLEWYPDGGHLVYNSAGPPPFAEVGVVPWPEVLEGENLDRINSLLESEAEAAIIRQQARKSEPEPLTEDVKGQIRKESAASTEATGNKTDATGNVTKQAKKRITREADENFIEPVGAIDSEARAALDN